MLGKIEQDNSKNLFYGNLIDMLDTQDELVILANNINWDIFEEAFKKHYSKDKGRKSKPIRLMVGLLILKQIENLSDEKVVLQFKRNPYYQYFCGYNEFQVKEPCEATELVKFRNRIGEEGARLIFEVSAGIHKKKDVEEKEVIVDTTVQEKNVTYPTDGKLAIKMINILIKIAKEHKIKLRRTYAKEIKQHRLNMRFFKHPKKIKKAKKSIKRLKTIVGILIRELKRKLPEDISKQYEELFELFNKVKNQKPKDKDKILSLHEPHIKAIAKGKEYKKYEYGTKASIAITKKSGIIVAVKAHKENIHDSKTLKEIIPEIKKINPKVCEVICDRGYRGEKNIDNVKVSIPSTPLKKDTTFQKKKKREKFKRRASIEPVIGHLKKWYRLCRNYLKGFKGDVINLYLSAAAWNFKKWLAFFYLFFIEILFVQEIKKYFYMLLILKNNTLLAFKYAQIRFFQG